MLANARSGRCVEGPLRVTMMLGVLVATLPAFGQDQPEIDRAPVPDTPATTSVLPSTTMVMVVEVGGTRLMTSGILEETMKRAAIYGDCKFDEKPGNPGARQISPKFFDEFQALLAQTRPTEPENEDADGVLIGRDYQISQDDNLDSYRLILKEPGTFLKSVKVNYVGKADDDQNSDTFTPDQEAVTSLGLDAKDREQYRITLPNVPASYTVVASEFGKPDQTYSGDWPAIKKCFSVTFEGFVGTPAMLRKGLQDERINEYVDRIQEVSDTRFFVASIGVDRTKPLPNRTPGYVLVEVPVNRPAITDVFVKLPLSAEDTQKSLKEWNDFRTYDRGELVLKKRREETPDEPQEDEELPNVTLKAGMSPQWYRLTPTIRDNGGGRSQTVYVRRFELGTAPERRKLLESFPGISMMVMLQSGEDGLETISTDDNKWVTGSRIEDDEFDDVKNANPDESTTETDN
ncbi:hypothetical protein [Thalassoroseus pseudoceratinae]|uniref:hypothetical protein n=1 Tax=Thalassoroseus pseudoceratinae TaxID=2713176 RepID=UPI00141DD65C|nr:hypothetical protein [Thalassoroseus pseudoceratinae]